jgi:hypothetical protein
MKSILLLTCTALALIAADATGTWTGTLTAPTSDGGERPGPAHLVLKQEGARLTGTAGPNPGEQHTIENGKAENGNLTFELLRDDSVMKFVLKQDGDEIKGDVTRERDGESQTAKLSVKREK